jgi:FtsZ-interacting cell division protein ZipA
LKQGPDRAGGYSQFRKKKAKKKLGTFFFLGVVCRASIWRMSGLFNEFFNSAKQKQNQFLKKKLLKKDESADSGAEDATEPEKAPKSKDVKSAPKKNEQVSEDKKQTKKRKAVDDAVAEQPQHQDSDHEETPSKKAKQMPKGKKNLDEMLEFSDEDSGS